VNRAEGVGPAPHTVYRIEPNEPVANLPGLRADVALHRNSDTAWDRLLERKTADRRIGLALRLAESDDGFTLSATDEDGFTAIASLVRVKEPARDASGAESALRDSLGKLGNTIFAATGIDIDLSQPWFLPASAVNALRRDAVAAVEAARAAGFERLPRAVPADPPAHYPEDTLTYLANVYNHKARDFYAKHGVKVIASAYESHEETGEVSLMITKHCVRFSLSMCPKQAKGVTGVQGQVRAEPLTITHGDDRLTLRFDCKPCEMHVVGRMRKSIVNEVPAAPITFYRAGAGAAGPRG
jgi:putative protease